MIGILKRRAETVIPPVLVPKPKVETPSVGLRRIADTRTGGVILEAVRNGKKARILVPEDVKKAGVDAVYDYAKRESDRRKLGLPGGGEMR